MYCDHHHRYFPRSLGCIEKHTRPLVQFLFLLSVSLFSLTALLTLHSLLLIIILVLFFCSSTVSQSVSNKMGDNKEKIHVKRVLALWWWLVVWFHPSVSWHPDFVSWTHTNSLLLADKQKRKRYVFFKGKNKLAEMFTFTGTATKSLLFCHSFNKQKIFE